MLDVSMNDPTPVHAHGDKLAAPSLGSREEGMLFGHDCHRRHPAANSSRSSTEQVQAGVTRAGCLRRHFS